MPSLHMASSFSSFILQLKEHNPGNHAQTTISKVGSFPHILYLNDLFIDFHNTNDNL